MTGAKVTQTVEQGCQHPLLITCGLYVLPRICISVGSPNGSIHARNRAAHPSNGVFSGFRIRLLAVFEEFGGVWAAEEVDGPVGEYVRPVEVIAELVQVNPLPDERPDQTTELYSQDVDEGAALSEIHQLAYGAVAEDDGCLVLDLCYKVRRCPPALLFCGLGEGRDRWSIVVYARAIANSIDPWPAFHPQVLVDEDPSAMVFLHVQVTDQGRGFDPGGPDGRLGRYGAPV